MAIDAASYCLLVLLLLLLFVDHPDASDQFDYTLIESVSCLREVRFQALVLLHHLEFAMQLAHMSQEFKLSRALRELLSCTALEGAIDSGREGKNQVEECEVVLALLVSETESSIYTHFQ